MKKALIVTRVSGFVPQFEMNNVHILQEMGYEVHYAANYEMVVYGKDNKRLENTGIIQHQIDFERAPYPWYVKKAASQLKKLLCDIDFDLIHVHMPMSSVVLRSVAQKVRRKSGRIVPVLYTAHGLHFYTGAPLKNWIYYPIEKHYARYTDRLILINKEDYIRAEGHFKVRGKVEHTYGIGMDLSKFKDYEKNNWDDGGFNELKATYGIPENHLVITSVGELTKRKNNIVMIRAMRELLDLPITYLICGSGPLENELRAEVREYGLENRVKFTGYITNVKEVLMQSDCFVFPSLQEGLPVAVMEAMAVGLPVIATAIRGITDLIEHTKGGYLVESFEPEDYAVKVRRLFTDEYAHSEAHRDIRRRQMGEWNRKRIQRFSIEVVDKKMREIYAEVEKEFM